MLKIGLRPFLSDFFIVLLALALFQQALPEIADDPGTGWHLATGAYVLHNWRVPGVDPFLSTHRAWVADQWAADALFAWIYQMGGWTWLAGIVFWLFLVSFCGLMLWGVRRLTRSPLLATVVTLGACKVAQIHFLVRPVVFSFAIFAGLYLMILFLMQSSEQKRRRYWWTIPLGFVVWANLHPFFLLGLFLLALWPLSLWIGTRFKLVSEPAPGDLKFALVVTTLSTVATLLNPYFFSLHLSILNLGTSDFFMNYHMEWLSPNFDNLEAKIAEFFSMLFLLGLVLNAWPVNSVDRIFKICALAVFAHGSLQANRILPFYMLVLTVPWVETMQALSLRLTNAPVLRLFPRLVRLERNSSCGLWGCIVVSVLALSVLAGFYSSASFAPSAEKYPYEAVKQLVASQLTPAPLTSAPLTSAPLTVVAPPSWGGFITWMSSGNLEPLLDDRNTLVGEHLYKDFHSAEADVDKMLVLMATYSSDYLILPKRHQLECQLLQSGHFEKSFEGIVANIFKKQTKATTN